MSGEQVVLHCSPTLSGIKPGNLFSVGEKSEKELYAQISGINQEVRDRGVRIIPLRVAGDRALVYVYRISALKNYFENADVARLLRSYGYRPQSPGGCIALLGKKLKVRKVFPHEVGLFLGFPPEDVSGFIENRARLFKCSGFWKVYGDEKKALKKFTEYRNCTRMCMKLYREGVSLRDLTALG